jgi:predicted site-specific integrase-resolvase
VVTTGDRLTRSGFQFIKWAVELHGGTIVELEESGEQREFDAADLVRFITCFIASYHGKRSSRRKKDKGVSSKRKSVG